MNVTVMSGKGKVHATKLTRRFTVCGRDLGPLARTTDAEVDCKTCTAKLPEIVAPTQADVVLFTGRVRHVMVKRARDARRAAMKAQLAAL